MNSEFKSFSEWINYPRWIYYNNIGMCSCGDLQCHGILKCHHCGTEFKPFPEMSLAQVIKRKMNFKDFDYCVRLYSILFSSQFKKFNPTLEDWKKELNYEKTVVENLQT